MQPMKVESTSFSNMNGLRLLIFDHISFDVPSGGLETLPVALKCMHWRGYPYQHLPLQYNLQNLVILSMPDSTVQLLWQGTKHPTKLKVLNLKFSKNLIRLPDLSAAVNLETLLLSGCSNLLSVHESVGCLKKLCIMEMEGCTELQNLLDSIQLESLKKLILSGCKKLSQFPKIAGKMNFLFDLPLDGTAVEELPSSIDNLTALQFLNLEGCVMLKHLPNTICNLKYLKFLIVNNCSMLKELPENLDKLESLKTLEADRCAFEKFPAHVTQLKRVKRLSLEGCSAVAPWSLNLPPFPCLQHLRYLNLSSCNLIDITSSIGQLFSLRTLNLLEYLDLSNCNLIDFTSSIGPLFFLRKLDLSRNDFVSIPESIGQLAFLEHLDLAHCKNITSVQLPWGLILLNADSCSSLEAIRHSSSSLKRKEHSSRQRVYQKQMFMLTNCSKYVHQHMSLMETIVLKFHAMAAKRRAIELFPRDQIAIWFPGTEIPEWFSHCAEGSSINMSLPSNTIFNYNLGVTVLCAVVSFPEEINPKLVMLRYKCSLGGKPMDPIYVPSIYDVESPCIGSDHVNLIYTPTLRMQCYKHVSQNPVLSVRFRLYGDNITAKIKKCGISLIETKCEGENIQSAILRNFPVCSNYGAARSNDIDDCVAEMMDTKHEA